MSDIHNVKNFFDLFFRNRFLFGNDGRFHLNASFISESVYRQTNRTGGGIFQEICADDLPEQFDSNDSSDSKSGAISGVKTGVISGVKSGTDYPTFALMGNREESAREKFPA